IGFIISYNLFRWDKEDRVSGRSKVWVTAVLAPFLLLGVWESYQGGEARRQAITYREFMRNRNWRIHDVRVFVGDGPVVDRADVYVRNGKIDSVVTDAAQAPLDQASFETLEGAGKTLMPGLIDAHTHLGGPA